MQSAIHNRTKVNQQLKTLTETQIQIKHAFQSLSYVKQNCTRHIYTQAIKTKEICRCLYWICSPMNTVVCITTSSWFALKNLVQLVVLLLFEKLNHTTTGSITRPIYFIFVNAFQFTVNSYNAFPTKNPVNSNFTVECCH